MHRDLSDYHHCVGKLRIMAGIRESRPKSIREALRDNTFFDTIQEAVHCRLLDYWPLREQQAFLSGISGLTDAEKSVRIYEQAYELYRASGGQLARKDFSATSSALQT